MTPKQKKFVEEYLIDLNATQAALRAGYKEKRAYSTGHENLKKPEIQRLIQEAQQARSKRTEITQDRVLQEYARIAFLNPKSLFNDDGTIRNIKELDDDTAACIAGMDLVSRSGPDNTDESVKKIKLTDKLRALQDLSKHLGMFEKNAGDENIAQPIQVIIQREDARKSEQPTM